jgi:hypothetical protein
VVWEENFLPDEPCLAVDHGPPCHSHPTCSAEDYIKPGPSLGFSDLVSWKSWMLGRWENCGFATRSTCSSKEKCEETTFGLLLCGLWQGWPVCHAPCNNLGPVCTSSRHLFFWKKHFHGVGAGNQILIRGAWYHGLCNEYSLFLWFFCLRSLILPSLPTSIPLSFFFFCILLFAAFPALISI